MTLSHPNTSIQWAPIRMKASPIRLHSLIFSVFVLFVISAAGLQAQDWVHTGTNLGNQRIRLAAADFKAVSTDPSGTEPEIGLRHHPVQ